MSTTGISFSGLASGLDSQAIIQALLAVEQRPIQAFQRKKSLLSTQKNLFGDVEQMLKDLVEKSKDIRQSTNFLDYKATSDDENTLTATASSSAASGSYDIRVVSLAKSQVKASTGDASATSQDYEGGNTLIFSSNNGTEYVSLSAGNKSLTDIANEVNAADIGVRAQVIDTGSDTDPFQLVFTSREPGTDNQFNVSTDLTGTSLEGLINEIEGNEITAGTDAVVELDGIQISRSSNQINNLIPGVTLDLIGAHSDTEPNATTRVTVTTDTEATSEKVKEFVDKYNEIVDFIEAQSVVNEDGEAQSELFGDVTLRSIRSTLRSIVGSTVDEAGSETFTMFAQIGISSDTEGRLTFTQSEFEAALIEDEDAVKAIFTNEDSGIANRIFSELDVFTDSIDGLIKARTDGIDRMSKQIDQNIERAERRLEQMELSLTQRYANLEVLINQLQGQGSAVNSIGAG